MKEIASEPFLPCVTEEEFLSFDPQRPETHTKSILMNAVLRAIAAVGAGSSKKICNYMHVSGQKLWPAVELLTGMRQLEFRQTIVFDQIERITCDHPDWTGDMIARAIGYSSRSDLYRVLGRSEYDREISYKHKSARYYKNRIKKDK